MIVNSEYPYIYINTRSNVKTDFIEPLLLVPPLSKGPDFEKQKGLKCEINIKYHIFQNFYCEDAINRRTPFGDLMEILDISVHSFSNSSKRIEQS